MKTKFNSKLFKKSIEKKSLDNLFGGGVIGGSGGTETGPTNHYPSGDTYETIYNDDCSIFWYDVSPVCQD
ncbi:hypothetical protein ULMA_15990 [Patiriisocius marinus]|uniref:Uncharacterized protein n=1 Tax=Patiriisocius marinus TaxID=1397112 RepID=A0A5J4J0Z7_9FLAO|nr:hypothetical protein [Patiriisocius marinus]GER59491.1 hypothetical protein ULMA_15990 [Patiriisocius marinus]